MPNTWASSITSVNLLPWSASLRQFTKVWNNRPNPQRNLPPPGKMRPSNCPNPFLSPLLPAGARGESGLTPTPPPQGSAGENVQNLLILGASVRAAAFSALRGG